MENNTIIVDHIEVALEGERNLLEVIRKVNIELPTFCYQPELSIYGACRMCIVEVEQNGRKGLMPACSTPPVPGMVITTNTAQIRKLRKITVELMLANHNMECTTCSRGDDCKLRQVANDLGIEKVRYRNIVQPAEIDDSSAAVVRDSSKCIKCGNCVRVCREIQSVGVLDFAYRGSDTVITVGFGHGLGESACIGCGQCLKVCPVGALTPNFQIDPVWAAISDETKVTTAAIAPAVRVAVGEAFGFQPGEVLNGKIATALRMLGFDRVYDTVFAADETILEEGTEFLGRVTGGGVLPQFTSCCPGWVKFVEQFYPEFIPNLSSCKSPQQMLGSTVKDVLVTKEGLKRENIVNVSIMPCTGKKMEAKRPEFAVDGNPDVDYVITSTELIRMIKQAGINFAALEPSEFDMPFGEGTGAGVIFGASGGVMEAALRFAANTLGYEPKCEQLRGEDGIRSADVTFGDITVRAAVVSGLANARQLMEDIKAGKAQYDIVEVMACPGGCVNGGGQPLHEHHLDTVARRTKGLFENDVTLAHSSEENKQLVAMFEEHFGKIGGHKSHELLHTTYVDRSKNI
ncbi:MAG: iron hydrogenase small subunit [Clostridia bacterium]|nr:iron hydrogenase small subunit [Clostridia bacterium]